MSPRTCRDVAGSAVPVTSRGSAISPAGLLDSRPGLVARYRRAIDALTRCRALLRQSQGDLATERADRRAAEDLCRALAADNQALRDQLANTEAERDAARAEAATDYLTGALTRKGLFDRWETMLAHLFLPPAVALVDLDWFKDINDCLGHAAGDAVLRAAAQRMAHHPWVDCPPRTVARIGGDEFVVLGCRKDVAAALPDVLAEALAQPLTIWVGWQRVVLRIGASIGATAPGTGLDAALAAADRAQYADKVRRRRDVPRPVLPHIAGPDQRRYRGAAA